MKTKEISMDSIIRQIDDIVASEIDGETVMMSIKNGAYYGLDLIASAIWERLANPVKVSDLVNSLVEKYEVDQETCQKDTLAFLNELNSNNIVQVEN